MLDDLNYNLLLVIPIILLVAMGNVLVIVAVCVEQNLRSATNCFLSSLAVADLLVALTVMPPSLAMIINNYKWPFTDTLCGIWVMLDVLFSTSSILHLAMLSFDRYMALARPFSHRNSSSTPLASTRLGVLTQNKPKALKRVAKRITFVWTVAFVIAIPIPILGGINRTNVFSDEMCTINMAKFQFFGSIAAFFVPLVFMFVMYTLTIKTLRKQAKMVSSLLVYNGKNSPNAPGHCKRQSHTRRSSRQGSAKVFHKAQYRDRKLHRRESSVTLSEHQDVTESVITMVSSTHAEKSSKSCCNCGLRTTDSADNRKKWWLRLCRPFIKGAQRLKTALCFWMLPRAMCNESEANSSFGKNGKCSCKENADTKPLQMKQTNQRNNETFHEKYRTSVRRISSSFKNKAMTSISTEQRASKVLGLIFVLFCLFWCPFFILNVMSRLCTTCNQELMGQLMNWFVWIGYVSSGVNPCVYTLFSRRFRRTFYLLIRCKMSLFYRHQRVASFSRRGSSAMSTRSIGANPSKSTPISAHPFMNDFDGADESSEVSPFVRNRSNSPEGEETADPEQVRSILWRTSRQDGGDNMQWVRSHSASEQNHRLQGEGIPAEKSFRDVRKSSLSILPYTLSELLDRNENNFDKGAACQIKESSSSQWSAVLSSASFIESSREQLHLSCNYLGSSTVGDEEDQSQNFLHQKETPSWIERSRVDRSNSSGYLPLLHEQTFLDAKRLSF